MPRSIRSECLLVSAGEASGDAMAAAVVERLSIPTFGMGGHALRRAGFESIVDTRHLAVMGFGAVMARAGDVARAAFRLLAAARRRRPRAALLVGYSEFNARLGGILRRLGTRVLWYAPPQVWAWRPGRAAALTKSCDAMAVVLPFEIDVWRRAGMVPEFVGHPALEQVQDLAQGLSVFTRRRLLLLPGSRTQEARRHWPIMLASAARLGARLTPSVVIAGSLGAEDRQWIEESAVYAGIVVETRPLCSALADADIALAASGTVTLECAAAGVPPVIVYRTDPLTYAIARRLVRVQSVGLPNLVLGHRVFPELVQHEADPARVARALLDVLEDRQRYARACKDVRRRLVRPDGSPSFLVARMLTPWLEDAS